MLVYQFEEQKTNKRTLNNGKENRIERKLKENVIKNVSNVISIMM